MGYTFTVHVSTAGYNIPESSVVGKLSNIHVHKRYRLLSCDVTRTDLSELFLFRLQTSNLNSKYRRNHPLFSFHQTRARWTDISQLAQLAYVAFLSINHW